MNIESSKIIIYQSSDGGLELPVNYREETIWLTQEEIAKLFDKARSTITEHILNVYEENELIEDSTSRNFRQVRLEGGRDIEREIKYYNLDMILSVGYRVSSQKATRFRQWSNKVLKQYILDGYTVNQKRLAENSEKLEEIQNTLKFITQNTDKSNLTLEEKTSFLELLKNYSKALIVLNQFDEDRLEIGQGKPSLISLQIDDYRNVIKTVKQDLIEKQEATELFGQEYTGKFDAIIGAVNQSFAGQELYPSIEQKASHLLYFIIKDHPFADGNKRLGSFLFIYFLEQNDFLRNQNGVTKILDNTLVALALLVAQSNPSDKEIIIKLICKLLQA